MQIAEITITEIIKRGCIRRLTPIAETVADIMEKLSEAEKATVANTPAADLKLSRT